MFVVQNTHYYVAVLNLCHEMCNCGIIKFYYLSKYMVKIHQDLLAEKLTFFLFIEENICCGYLLEAPHQSSPNEYPQHMFSSKSKKKYIIS